MNNALLYFRAYLQIWMDEIRKLQRYMYSKLVILRKHAHAHIDTDRYHRLGYKLLEYLLTRVQKTSLTQLKLMKIE